MSKASTIAVAEVGAAAAPSPKARAVATVVPEGEVIILRLKPHPLFIVLSILGPVLACLVVAGVMRWMSSRQVSLMGSPVLEFPNLGRLWMVPVLLALLGLGWQSLEWWARVYLLTDRRVVRVGGVLRQLVIEVPLPRVQQVVLYRSLRERVCGLGTPGISSAASGDLSFVFWNMVSRPAERLKVLRETVAKYGGNGHGAGTGAGGGGTGGNGGGKVGA